MLNDPEWARVLPALLMLKTHADGIADLEKRLGGAPERSGRAS